MRSFYKFYILLIVSVQLIGCKPSADVPVENPDPTETSARAPVSDTVEVSSPAEKVLEQMTRAPKEVEAAVESPRIEYSKFIVLNEPWGQYFRSKPKVLILPEMSSGITKLLNEEQRLIKSVLDSGGKANNSSEYVVLREKLEELKTVIPQAETSSGYVPGSYNRRSYSYVSGGVIYHRNYYYDGYYTVLRQKSASSSEELVRSVEGIAHNATLEDLDQRINALQGILSKWNKRTSEMSPNGTSGIMREANEAYLKGLQEFTQEFLKIRKELRKVEDKQAAIARNRATILEDWRSFETTRLPIIDDYFKANAEEQISPGQDDAYKLPKNALHNLIYACEIGERILYFKLSTAPSSQHPFSLVNIGVAE